MTEADKKTDQRVPVPSPAALLESSQKGLVRIGCNPMTTTPRKAS